MDPERCVGCGTCEEVCMEDAIHPTADGKYEIKHFGCLECGRCAMNCPNDAIDCNCR
ncbi:4Fe-4S binding protein [Blautia sp. RD014234]|nr:4Fe-4S binding protein [Blautia parvula]